ncbi:hypothetical protein [Paenibacillus sp. HJGM_3]|uniref:hypothetical protein n=1 Tax=Paenibacillus sp. HJGM_3 TaxID=3379816 RepID=UPI00386728A0
MRSSGLSASGAAIIIVSRTVLLLTMMLFGVVLSVQATPASAGFISGVKSFFQLPGEVDRLQTQYEDTKQQLDRANQELDVVSREAKETLQQFKESEQKLIEQNARLAEQNEQLQRSIQLLQQAERERAAKYRRTMTMIFTAAGLIVLYFVLNRVMRVVLRTR